MEKITNFFKKLIAGLKKKEKKTAGIKQPLRPVRKKVVPKSEFELLTNKIIYETIGPKGSMKARLEGLLRFYEAENNPIGTDAAKKIMFAVISNAIAQRDNILFNFVAAIKNGEITAEYYEKLNKIESLELRANAATTDAAVFYNETIKAKGKLEAIENADRAGNYKS